MKTHLRRASPLFCLAGASLGLISSPSAADLPATPAAVEIRGIDATVHTAPSRDSGRRGVPMKGTRFSVLETRTGPGCSGEWLKIYTEAWICSREVVATTEAPEAQLLPALKDDQLTPWPYAFVREATLEYKMSLGILYELRDMLPGFGFAVTGTVTYEGERYLKSTENTLIPASAASIASRISSFEGVELGGGIGGAGMVAWVNASSSSVYNEPRIAKTTKVDTIVRYSVVFVTDQPVVGKKRFAKIGDNRYVNRADLRVMGLVAPPSGLMPEERWIDVDTGEQILTAYEGERPVFVTLISSGRRGPSATVKGEYRIWAKVAAIAMDNSDDETEPLDMDVDGVPGEPRLYSLRHVPWTQFFHKAYALHGVYWHDRFGNRRSHGCINLSPKDARRLYDWTDPPMPPGFWSMHSTENSKGTLIRIR